MGDDAYDPIAAWYNNVTKLVLRNHVTKRKLAQIEMIVHDMGAQMEDIILVDLFSEDLKPVKDVYTLLARIGLDDISKSYTRMYVLQICRVVATVIIEISYIALGKLNATSSKGGKNTTDLPFMREIFGLFMCDDKYFRSRKTWSIYES